MTKLTKDDSEKILAADLGNLVKKVKRGKTLTDAERELIKELGHAEIIDDSKNTIDKICQFTLLDPKVILRLGKLGYFPMAKKGIYELDPTLKGCFRYLKEEQEKHRVKPGPVAGSQSLPIYNSMTHCLSGSFVPIEVQRKAKKEGCEAFRFARVELASLLKFLFNQWQAGALVRMLGKEQAQPELPLEEGKIGGRAAWEEIKAQREQIKLRRDKEEVISKEEVKHGILQAMSELFGTLERVLCNEMPPTLVGMRELEVRRRVKTELDSCKEQLRKRFAELEATTSGSGQSPTGTVS